MKIYFIFCRDNININDVVGNFSLTLVDSLDTLAILGNTTEFKNAVQRVLETVSFDRNSTVQVFETNIRCDSAFLQKFVKKAKKQLILFFGLINSPFLIPSFR